LVCFPAAAAVRLTFTALPALQRPASSIYTAFKISLTPLSFLVKQFPIKKPAAGVLRRFPSEGSEGGTKHIKNTAGISSVPALLLRRAGVAEDALEALDVLRLAERFGRIGVRSTLLTVRRD
jgi:hypothetical protein